MSFDAKLKTELDTDPEGMGYDAAGWSAKTPTEDQYKAVSGLLNGATRSRGRDVLGDDLFRAIRPDDLIDLFGVAGNPGHQEYVRSLLALDSVPLSMPVVRSTLRTIFTGKTATLSAISSLQDESISRAIEVAGQPVKVGDLRRLKGDKS